MTQSQPTFFTKQQLLEKRTQIDDLMNAHDYATARANLLKEIRETTAEKRDRLVILDYIEYGVKSENLYDILAETCNRCLIRFICEFLNSLGGEKPIDSEHLIKIMEYEKHSDVLAGLAEIGRSYDGFVEFNQARRIDECLARSDNFYNVDYGSYWLDAYGYPKIEDMISIRWPESHDSDDIDIKILTEYPENPDPELDYKIVVGRGLFTLNLDPLFEDVPHEFEEWLLCKV